MLPQLQPLSSVPLQTELVSQSRPKICNCCLGIRTDLLLPRVCGAAFALGDDPQLAISFGTPALASSSILVEAGRCRAPTLSLHLPAPQLVALNVVPS